MFGTKTNEFMVRATSVLAVIFVMTSLTLAHLYARRDQSLMERLMDKTKKPDIQINIPLDDKNAKTSTPVAVSTDKDTKTSAEPVAVTPKAVDVTAAPDAEKQ